MLKIVRICLVVGLFVCGMTDLSNAMSVLHSGTGGSSVYGIGLPQWSNFSNAINTATSNNLMDTINFENYNQMLQYDAIWLDQRGPSGALSSIESVNIALFASTGRKVVMMGDNSAWTDWNNQILDIVGGTYVAQFSGTALSGINNSLTSGAPSIFTLAGGVASGGTALYNPNFATLWNGNVLTVLDVNVWAESNWVQNNNGAFGINVANWIADSNNHGTVPEPSTFILLGVGLGSLMMLRKRTSSKHLPK